MQQTALWSVIDTLLFELQENSKKLIETSLPGDDADAVSQVRLLEERCRLYRRLRGALGMLLAEVERELVKLQGGNDAEAGSVSVP